MPRSLADLQACRVVCNGWPWNTPWAVRACQAIPVNTTPVERPTLTSVMHPNRFGVHVSRGEVGLDMGDGEVVGLKRLLRGGDGDNLRPIAIGVPEQIARPQMRRIHQSAARDLTVIDMPACGSELFDIHPVGVKRHVAGDLFHAGLWALIAPGGML